MSTLKKNFRAVKKSVKKTGRKLSAGLLTVAAVGAMLPYRLEKEQNPISGDRGVAVTSLLFRTSVSPKCEDSEKQRTLLSVSLRPMSAVREDLAKLEQIGKKKPKVEPPYSLTPEEEKALKKARKKAKKTAKKIEKKRAKEAAKRMAAAEAKA